MADVKIDGLTPSSAAAVAEVLVKKVVGGQDTQITFGELVNSIVEVLASQGTFQDSDYLLLKNEVTNDTYKIAISDILDLYGALAEDNTFTGAQTFSQDIDVLGVAVKAKLDDLQSQVTSNENDIASLESQINAIQPVLAPAGTVSMFAGAAAPSGWLLANGQAVSRVTYANLFAVIGTFYGNGDGATTFNLPDVRGYFPRFLNSGSGIDPDAGSRTDRGDGTTGDAVGTKQGYEVQSHEHLLRVRSGISGNISSDGFLTTQNDSVTLDMSSSNKARAEGGNETRPVNIAFLGIIKY